MKTMLIRPLLLLVLGLAGTLRISSSVMTPANPMRRSIPQSRPFVSVPTVIQGNIVSVQGAIVMLNVLNGFDDSHSNLKFDVLRVNVSHAVFENERGDEGRPSSLKAGEEIIVVLPPKKTASQPMPNLGTSSRSLEASVIEPNLWQE